MISLGWSWGWPALFLLGAYHGINPGMGWLLAVARGMQEHATKAVARALVHCFRSPKPQLHLAAPSVFSGLVALQVAPPG
jgi:hypothetical protein